MAYQKKASFPINKLGNKKASIPIEFEEQIKFENRFKDFISFKEPEILGGPNDLIENINGATLKSECTLQIKFLKENKYGNFGFKVGKSLGKIEEMEKDREAKGEKEIEGTLTAGNKIRKSDAASSSQERQQLLESEEQERQQLLKSAANEIEDALYLLRKRKSQQHNYGDNIINAFLMKSKKKRKSFVKNSVL